MPTYLGVWGKQPAEQVKRVESVSFGYLLLATLSYAIWTSYAFQIQNVDLLFVSIVPCMVNGLLSLIYLYVIPDRDLIMKFAGMILICQIFNFDLVSTANTGTLGTLMTIM